ncbi:baseplate J/gp47 family protein [Phytohabitans kaempferiae]|uniref:Baseplate J/gp47 family protein n=1 Tax=Phytohabitans kaempferiae TaxID=1620943 RepID=A0ABV6MFF2_9ACTN
MFTARRYPDIVADILVAVTQGVVGETLTVPGVLPEGHLLFLTSRPVRRVSLVAGEVEGADGTRTPWRFTDADWELVSSTGRPDEADALRFRPRRARPAGGSLLRVSYWPRDVPPVPLTDLGVGSVTRTLLETLAREVADAEAQLQVVYESAFVDTATGRALDRVVALLGIERRGADVPVGKVRFQRLPGAAGLVTVPVGTVVMSVEGARYRTTREATLQPGETSVEVPIAGESRATPVVAAGELDRPAVSIAGVDRVANDAATFQPAGPEEDEALRARARRAFHGVGVGTLDALVHGLGGLDGVVTGVRVTEFPEGRAGTVDLDVALVQPDNADHVALVRDTIERLRPAGIRVAWRAAAQVDVVVDVTRLVLTGRSRPVAELDDIRAGLTDRLAGALQALPPGGRLAAARAAALALADERISDLDLTFTVDGESGRAEVALPPSKSARPVTPIVLPPPVYTEAAAPGPQTRLQVRVVGPVQIFGSATLAAVTESVRARTQAWLAASTVLDLSSFAAAVRDDAVYALVLEEVALVLEREGRFEQLVLGSAPRPVAADETPEVAGVDLEEQS